jgi:hypothetical protein
MRYARRVFHMSALQYPRNNFPQSIRRLRSKMLCCHLQGKHSLRVFDKCCRREYLYLKLCLHDTNRETSQVGRLSAPRFLTLVNVYLPEIRSKPGWV